MEGDPAALAEVRALGVPRVPAVAVGGRVVHGWNPRGYAELVGVEYREADKLPPAELHRRLDRILASAEGLIRDMPAAHLGVKPPERNRDLRDLAFHVFRVGLTFPDAMDSGRLPEEWFEERAPRDLADGPAVARYGALVRGRVGGWAEGAAASEYERVVDVYYGPQSGHELLERTTWHAAQHLRQLYALAEGLGVRPPEPLPAAALEGLPLPDSVW